LDSDSLLESIHHAHSSLVEEISYEKYLERVLDQPWLARRAHALIHDALVWAARREGDEGSTERWFKRELFGLDDVARSVADYFAAAARGFEVANRILLLVGPPGAGKSTLVNSLKSLLEEYTRTEEGVVYAIKGCPLHEDPLHLIPADHRGDLRMSVEGDLCPYCRWMLREIHGGDVRQLTIERVTFDQSEAVGIGTFVATDPHSSDLKRLVGSVDRSQLWGVGTGGARRAFQLDGELNVANRGFVNLVELFKMDERFLAVLLTVSQEKTVKVRGPGTVYVDEALIAESNLAEYRELVENPKAVAMLDRLVVVRVPYVLSVTDEVRIYEKLIGRGDLHGSHISPLALRGAATVAVLTRIERSPGLRADELRKLRFYDRRYVHNAEAGEYDALHGASTSDGLRGVSPRFIVNQIARVVIGERACVSGMEMLRVLWDRLDEFAGHEERDTEEWNRVFSLAKQELDDVARLVLRRASVPAYADEVDRLAAAVQADLESENKPEPESAGKGLRDVERALGIPEYRRTAWRAERRARLRARPSRDDDPEMFEGIDRMVLPEWVEVARGLQSKQRRDEVGRRLVAEHGFCDVGAQSLLEHAESLTRSRRPRRQDRRLPPWLRA